MAGATISHASTGGALELVGGHGLSTDPWQGGNGGEA